MKTQKNLKTFSVSIPSEDYKKLEQVAKKNSKSKNFYIKKAIENLLEDLFFAREAEKILKKGINKTYTLQEIRKKHDL